MVQKKTKRFLAIIGLCLAAWTSADAQTPAKRSVPIAFAKNELIQVNIHQLVVDPASQQPVVSLADSDKKRAMLIWIGISEARAIYSELKGIKHFRPLTHDLLERVIQKVDGKINQITITHAKENVFYATIVMQKEDTLIEIDARPSDSIVMALKFEAPIFVSKTLFDKMAVPLEEQEAIEKEYGLTLQDLTPELAKYLSFESNQGALVSGLRKGSRAEKDGFEEGDIIVEIGGQSVEDVSSMKNTLARSKTPVKARIFRKSRYLIITLHLN